MLTPYQIPLQSNPQILNITLAGTQYTLTIKWNSQCQSWVIDIADVNGNPILSGVPMVTGTDLLGQFEYLNFGGELVAQTMNATDDVPDFTNLGTNGNLYFLVEQGEI